MRRVNAHATQKDNKQKHKYDKQQQTKIRQTTKHKKHKKYAMSPWPRYTKIQQTNTKIRQTATNKNTKNNKTQKTQKINHEHMATLQSKSSN